jgi:hypothetical protein
MQAGDRHLTKSKYLWLTNPANMTEKAKARFDELKACRTQDRPGVGAEGGAAGTVELHLRDVGSQVLEALVLLGDAQPPAAHDRRRQADRPPLAQCADLLCRIASPMLSPKD